MSGRGNNTRLPVLPRQRGFTLLELLLVVTITAIASAGVVFALRGAGQQQLAREADRLIAVLEAARAHSRATGVPVVWRGVDGGFELLGVPEPESTAAAGTTGNRLAPRMRWLADGTAAPAGSVLSLGPEPIIGAQQLQLLHDGGSLRIATDGLRPFAVVVADGVR